MSPPYNLEIDYAVGDTAPISLGLTDAVSGLAYILTGLLDAWFTVQTLSTGGTVVISRRLGNGISVSDATGATTGGLQSIVDITPTAVESAALVADTTYYAFLRVKGPAGSFVTVASGYFNATPSAPASLT